MKQVKSDFIHQLFSFVEIYRLNRLITLLSWPYLNISISTLQIFHIRANETRGSLTFLQDKHINKELIIKTGEDDSSSRVSTYCSFVHIPITPNYSLVKRCLHVQHTAFKLHVFCRKIINDLLLFCRAC